MNLQNQIIQYIQTLEEKAKASAENSEAYANIGLESMAAMATGQCFAYMRTAEDLTRILERAVLTEQPAIVEYRRSHV
jgi:hypothetical protein